MIEPMCSIHVGQSHACKSRLRRCPAKKLGRNEGMYLIDHSGIETVPENLTPSFHEDVCQAPMTEFTKQGTKIGMTERVLGDFKYLDAHRAEQSAAVFGGASRHDDNCSNVASRADKL
jgi:hypothetical protein